MNNDNSKRIEAPNNALFFPTFRSQGECDETLPEKGKAIPFAHDAGIVGQI